MDWQSVVKTVAPWIGTALTGPLGGLAVGAIADALGVQDKTTEAVKAAIAGATPEQMLALQTADQQFEISMRKLGFENAEHLAGIALDNTKDARAMQIATRSNIPAVLSVIVVVGFLGILLAMMLGKLEVKDNQSLLLLLGSLCAAFGACINYWLGSSIDSSRKTELLAASPAIGTKGQK